MGQKMAPEHCDGTVGGQFKTTERLEHDVDLSTVEADAKLCTTRICARAL